MPAWLIPATMMAAGAAASMAGTKPEEQKTEYKDPYETKVATGLRGPQAMSDILMRGPLHEQSMQEKTGKQQAEVGEQSVDAMMKALASLPTGAGPRTTVDINKAINATATNAIGNAFSKARVGSFQEALNDE